MLQVKPGICKCRHCRGYHLPSERNARGVDDKNTYRKTVWKQWLKNVRAELKKECKFAMMGFDYEPNLKKGFYTD